MNFFLPPASLPPLCLGLLCVALYVGLVWSLLVAASRADEALGGPDEGNADGGDGPRGSGPGGQAPQGGGDGASLARGAGAGDFGFTLHAYDRRWQSLYAAQRALAYWDGDAPGGLIFEEPHVVVVEVVR